ncbi:MAG: hypothetical protein ACKOEP_05230 [Phycisphaerales bacterium]
MRSAVLLSWAAASAWANAAWSGVTVTGGGWAFGVGEIDKAMAIVNDQGDAGVNYFVHATSAISYSTFTQSVNTTLAWGTAPGVLRVEGDLSSAGTILFEIVGKSNSGAVGGGTVEFDTTLVMGNIDLRANAALRFVVASGVTFERGDTFTLMATADGKTIVADLEQLRARLDGLPSLPDGLDWELRISQGSFEGYGGDSLVLMAVPMPGPAALFALAAVTGARRRRR